MVRRAVRCVVRLYAAAPGRSPCARRRARRRGRVVKAADLRSAVHVRARVRAPPAAFLGPGADAPAAFLVHLGLTRGQKSRFTE